MTTVFLSYSTTDHFFAELASLKLQEANIQLWRDQGELRAGSEWRGGIEDGIRDSTAVIVALSKNSTESAYVTFEWAYALGREKVVIPLKLEQCDVHARLEPIQYLDFSIQGSLPWESLVERIREIESDDSSEPVHYPPADPNPVDDPTVKAILGYLNQRGYRMMSFERVRRRVDNNLTDEKLEELIKSHEQIFSKATLKGNKPGLKIVH